MINKKIIVSLLTMLIMIFYCYNFAEASIDDFQGSSEGETFSKSIINMILPAVRAVAAGVAIIAITVMGTKYMAAAPTERAEIKDQIIKFVIGVLLVTGATKVVEMLQDIAGRVRT